MSLFMLIISIWASLRIFVIRFWRKSMPTLVFDMFIPFILSASKSFCILSTFRPCIMTFFVKHSSKSLPSDSDPVKLTFSWTPQGHCSRMVGFKPWTVNQNDSYCMTHTKNIICSLEKVKEKTEIRTFRPFKTGTNECVHLFVRACLACISSIFLIPTICAKTQ